MATRFAIGCPSGSLLDISTLLIYYPTMNTSFKRPFSQYVKKSRRPLQLAIEDAVEEVCVTPDIGESKQGDLGGIRVYKFRFQRQEYLLAYRLTPGEQSYNGEKLEELMIDFYQIGTHENFYDELKRFIRSEG